MDYNQAALEMHETHHGKVGIVSKVEVKTRDDLATAYTPGVAEPCRKIAANPADVYRYTFKNNMVAVVSNGTAVLGLGDIGPEAALPVMEGKAVLFHRPHLRRHQPGGHQEPRVLRDRADPGKGAGHPGIPR